VYIVVQEPYNSHEPALICDDAARQSAGGVCAAANGPDLQAAVADPSCATIVLTGSSYQVNQEMTVRGLGGLHTVLPGGEFSDEPRSISIPQGADSNLGCLLSHVYCEARRCWTRPGSLPVVGRSSVSRL
jgi:hypothetical protein